MKHYPCSSIPRTAVFALTCATLLLSLAGFSNRAEAEIDECTRYKSNDQPYTDPQCVRAQRAKRMYGGIQIKNGPGVKEQIREKCTFFYKDTDEPFLDRDCVRFLTDRLGNPEKPLAPSKATAQPTAREQVRERCTRYYKDTDEPFLDEDCVRRVAGKLGVRVVEGADCEAVTATEAICNGSRYVSERTSFTDSWMNAVKKLFESKPKYTGK